VCGGKDNALQIEVVTLKTKMRSDPENLVGNLRKRKKINREIKIPEREITYLLEIHCWHIINKFLRTIYKSQSSKVGSCYSQS
jgi:hypothetical protein